MKPSPSPKSDRARESRRPGGAVIGDRYVVLRRLGAGSLGTVYLTRDTATGREVALKLLRTDRLTSAAIEGLQREFQTIASIRHPRIATAYDFGYVDDGRVPFLTREYVPGSPLAAGPPVGQRPAEFLRPILDLLDALDTLHRNGLLHLDIHAGNLIVADDAERGAVLIDFGLVRDSVGARSARPEPQDGPPTPRLDAGDSSSFGTSLPALVATASTDLFLVGRLLVERLTGRTDCRPELPAEIPGWGARRTLALERIAAKALQRAISVHAIILLPICRRQQHPTAR